MVESGIGHSEDIAAEFNKLRMNRAYRYIIFKLNAGKTAVEIENIGAREKGFEDFKEQMPKD